VCLKAAIKSSVSPDESCDEKSGPRRTKLDDGTLCKDEDLVEVDDGPQAVGDDEQARGGKSLGDRLRDELVRSATRRRSSVGVE
jgi:hypothetical protein